MRTYPSFSGRRFGVARSIRARWAWWTALLSVIVLVAQVPAQAVDSSTVALSGTSASPAVPSSQSKGCTAKAPADPPLWEQSLPIAKVSSSLSATDPACVHEVGRSASSVVWRNPDGSLTSNLYSGSVNYRAADGSWQPIDTRLTADAQGGFTNRAGPFSVHFAPTASWS